jgi:hypothetical protein
VARRRISETTCAVLAAASWWLSPAAAAAQSAGDAAVSAEDATLAEARAALEQRRFAVALEKAGPLRRSTNRPARAEALEIFAVAAIASGKKDDGEQALRELYKLQPAFELGDPSLPEPVRRAFEAEAARPNPDRVALRVTTPATGAPAVEVTADRPVSTVRLACRVEAGLAFAPLATTGGGAVHRGELRSARPHACIALALDADGLVVGRQGSRAHPVELHPASRGAASAASDRGSEQPRGAAAASTGPALTERWWFWTALGTVVVAGTITVVVAVAASSDGPPSEQVGTNRPTLFAF